MIESKPLELDAQDWLALRHLTQTEIDDLQQKLSDTKWRLEKISTKWKTANTALVEGELA